ncbi:mRNA decay activator protein ZFP36L2-like [Branchiostoma floridae]|uniref:mRNA decay activator protein ZFP36L2-like n=1 Tax=Branchiostoma floridae TaxID=7739 RepID=A0A9J7LCT5_BRAFL|nr:mRNA decay activator protein ZFP36L2-like [Branchiostoma floridae]
MTAAGTDQGSTEKMSTALVSAFYDVGDVLYKNQKNNNMQWKPDRKAVGSPVGTTGFPRRHSTSSVSPTLRELGNSKYSNTLISIPDGGLLLTGNNKENHQGNGKRDRLQSDGGEGKKSNINSSRYKTELCRPFEENGHCKYGDKCQFAHGVHELRTLARHPKYKTELCRTFHTIGFCPYGPRCHFIHNPGGARPGPAEPVRVLSVASSEPAQLSPRSRPSSQRTEQPSPQQQLPAQAAPPAFREFARAPIYPGLAPCQSDLPIATPGTLVLSRQRRRVLAPADERQQHVHVLDPGHSKPDVTHAALHTSFRRPPFPRRLQHAEQRKPVQCAAVSARLAGRGS